MQKLSQEHMTLLDTIRSQILAGNPFSSFAFLKTYFFSRGFAHLERLWTVHPTRGAL